MKNIFISFLFLFLFSHISAQVNVKDSSIFTPMIYGFYAYDFSAGDLAERYGNFSEVGPGFQIKLKSNWLFGVEYSHYWGAKVKNEDQILQHILTSDGQVIATDGTYASFYMKGRGYKVSGFFGKLFPVLSQNPNSGIIIKAGVGYIQHWIRIRINQDKTIPSFEGDYALGYDRLTSGLAINEFIGYLYMGNTRILNFYVGFEFMQSWTQNRREVNFDTGLKEEGNRFDALNGFKIGWIIPIYKRTPKEYYYY